MKRKKQIEHMIKAQFYVSVSYIQDTFSLSDSFGYSRDKLKIGRTAITTILINGREYTFLGNSHLYYLMDDVRDFMRDNCET